MTGLQFPTSSTLLSSTPTPYPSIQSLGPVGLRGEGGGVEGSKVELAENRLILSQIYSTLFPLPLPQSKQTII